MAETTLILLKPDCIAAGNCGEVIKRFEAEGFKIRGSKMQFLSDEKLAEHYSHLTDKPFFPSIVEFMQQSPVIAMALEGDNAITRVRDLLGPTDSTAAEKGTIRGDLGVDVQQNVCHASDSPEAAEAELKRFFDEGDLFNY